jgi:hypothetical protein
MTPTPCSGVSVAAETFDADRALVAGDELVDE